MIIGLQSYRSAFIQQIFQIEISDECIVIDRVVSVASSTLSSQLGNILGQLSENWNISPSFRSEKGDFSDMEVELALSSQLLNNRLIFNGNFGYDKKVAENILSEIF